MKRVLIVDDKQEVRELVEVTLRVGDYEVFQAASGQEAVERSAKLAPDLIIMDVMMPGAYDGLEATRRIREAAGGDGKGPRIIMLTALADAHDREKGRKAGADAYLVKPFGPLELIETLEEVLA